MKKVFLMLIAGAFLSTSLISCSKKCGHCNLNGSTGPQYCSKDNQVVYDAAVSSCATGGGSWTLK